MNFINPYDIIEIPILEFIRNMAIGLLLAVMFAWLVRKSTRLVVDTTQYMPLFLLLIPTMILIITVIKTSIALSLGLVGALSIIRFRTPIKRAGGTGLYIHCYCHWPRARRQPGAGYRRRFCCGGDSDVTGNV